MRPHHAAREYRLRQHALNPSGARQSPRLSARLDWSIAAFADARPRGQPPSFPTNHHHQLSHATYTHPQRQPAPNPAATRWFNLVAGASNRRQSYHLPTGTTPSQPPCPRIERLPKGDVIAGYPLYTHPPRAARHRRRAYLKSAGCNRPVDEFGHATIEWQHADQPPIHHWSPHRLGHHRIDRQPPHTATGGPMSPTSPCRAARQREPPHASTRGPWKAQWHPRHFGRCRQSHHRSARLHHFP